MGMPLQEQWANRLNELEANEEGRAIAADTASLGAYLQVAKAKPPERANTSSLLAKLEGIRDSAARLAVAPLLKEPPSLEQKAELDAITRKIQDAILTHESSLNELDTIARLAQSKGGSASQTLGEALDAERTRAEEERAEIYRLAFEKAEAETRRELERIASETAASIAQMKQQMAAREAADAKDHETRLAELEHAASRAKQSAVEAEAETARQLEAQRAQDASEKAALEGLKKRAQSSEVQDMLSPFITPDYYQLHGDVVTEKSPMSYQAMERAGAFVLGVPGLINLYEIALSERNSRPKGGWGTVAGTTGHFEMNYGEAAKRAYVAKVQQTLVELKPALLELKMMRP